MGAFKEKSIQNQSIIEAAETLYNFEEIIQLSDCILFLVDEIEYLREIKVYIASTFCKNKIGTHHLVDSDNDLLCALDAAFYNCFRSGFETIYLHGEL